MKLTFKTKGKVDIDYWVRMDNENRDVERTTVEVISRYGNDVIDEISVARKMEVYDSDYLAAMLGCRPDNVDVEYSSVDCQISVGELSITGIYVFDVDDEQEFDGLPSDDVICENIQMMIKDAIHDSEDFIESPLLYINVNSKFYDNVDVSFYYDYKPMSCEANLEK